MDIEKKLDLIRYIRNEEKNNHTTMRMREHILYGPIHEKQNDSYSYLEHMKKTENTNAESSEDKIHTFSTLRFRFFIAVFIFLSFFYIELNDISIGIITSNWIVELIDRPFDTKFIDFIEEFPYTLTID
ncbi:MAG: hypothetical protein ACRC7V_08520 [Lachnospiraceae bacterium]